MSLSLPVRLSLTVALLLSATVVLTLVVSHRVALNAMAGQSDRAAQGIFAALSVSHAGELLGQRPEDVAEMRRAASRIVRDEASGVQALAFHDAAGAVVAEDHTDTAGAVGPLATLPPTFIGVPALPGVRRWVGPVRFAERPIGAVTLELRDDLVVSLRPQLTQAHVWLGGLVILVGAVLVFLSTRLSLKTIPALAQAIERVREADFAVRVPVVGPEDFRRLGEAFNEMSRRLELFSQYTNPAVVRALIQDPDLGGPGGALRHVSVVFADMRGFTRMSADRPPADVLRQVNLYFRLFEKVVLDHGGHIDKYMGDAMMAVFGLFDAPLPDLHRRLAQSEPIPYSQQAVRAMVRARDAVRVINAYLLQTGSTEPAPGRLTPQIFGCGIASGHVTAGNLGGEKKKDYSVVGNIVNLAARLESQSRRGEVLIDTHTRRNMGDAGEVAARPPVELKGFDRPVVPYEVVSLRGDVSEDAADSRGYLSGVFTESFVHHALLRGDPLVSAAEVHQATLALHRILASTPLVMGAEGPESAGTA